ncbi:MAG: radical SAM protein [Candidatus Bathyarchaeia archaeon]
MESRSRRSTVYGPVLSWRLGRSLGIDPLLQPKTCTFDCLYCQLGRTYRKVSEPIEGLPLTRDVLKDLRRSLKLLDLDSVDYVTFSGSGEPSLNPELGDMIEAVKGILDKPIAVLTNSSLLHKEAVRRSLGKADLVVAKLDAPSQELLEAINRPIAGILLEKIVEGIESLRAEMMGRLAIQIMFFECKGGILSNTSLKDVEALILLTERISPEEVQLNTPTRPPSEGYVLALEPNRMEAIAEAFRRALSKTRVVSRYEEREGLPPKRICLGNIDEEILGLINRRPCSFQEIARSLNLTEFIVKEHLLELLRQKKITKMEYRGYEYYTVP